MSRYAKELTKEDLINRYGISDVTPDGRIFNAAGEEIKQHIYTSNKNKKYLCISVYDKIDRVKVPRKVYVKDKVYTSYTYKISNLGVHRVVYIWFNGIQPEGYVVDHIDNNPLNNNLSNLQLLTPKQNLNKDQKKFMAPIKCKMNKPRKFYEDKLAGYLKEYEEAKEEGNAEIVHRLRSNISQTKARLLYWDLHVAEYTPPVEKPPHENVTEGKSVKRIYKKKNGEEVIKYYEY